MPDLPTICLWFRVKGQKRAHIRDFTADVPPVLVPTGCDQMYGNRQVAEEFAETPPVRERCRGCDAWYTQNRAKVERYVRNGQTPAEGG